MSEDETNRKLLKPDCHFSHVLRICEDLYQLTENQLEELKRFESYDDQNFFLKLNVEVGEWASKQLVLKITNGVDSRNTAVMESQNKLMLHLRHDSEMVAPVPLAVTGEGQISYYDLPTKGGDCQRLAVRLLEFVPGKALCDVKEVNDNDLGNAGRLLASFARAVEGITESEEGYAGFKRTHSWDLQNTLNLGEDRFLGAISSESDRALVSKVLDRFNQKIVPLQESLRKSLIMGDLNDANMIKCKPGEKANKTGLALIDFGDTIFSWTVADIAIAMAYALLCSKGKALLEQNKPNLQCALALLEGYREAGGPLLPEETELLHTLMCARLAMSVTYGAYSYACDPGNEYLLLHAQPAWASLERLWAVPEEEFLGLAEAALAKGTPPGEGPYPGGTPLPPPPPPDESSPRFMRPKSVLPGGGAPLGGMSGNYPSPRPSTRVRAPPGGASSITFG